VRATVTIPRPNPAGRFNPECLFRPKSVALIGAETATGAHILANLNRGSFKGEILQAERPALLPAAPDLAILATAAEPIGPSLAALAARGCHAAIVADPVAGLAEAARCTGVRVLGPRSFGLFVSSIGLNASRAHLPPPNGRLALLAQSAGLTRTVIDWAEPNGVGFSNIVGIGDNADIGFGTVLDWLSRDPGTGSILLEIGRLKNRRAFLSAARAAARLRPVVAVHSAERASDSAFEAALRRAGVLSVQRFEDLLAAAETLSRARPVRSESVAIVANALGAGALAANAVLQEGLSVAELPDTKSSVIEIAPGDGAHLEKVVTSLAETKTIGGVLVVHTPTGGPDADTIGQLPRLAANAAVPILVCAMGETTGAKHRAALAQSGLAVFATPTQAVRGFRHLVQDRRNRAAARELPPAIVLSFAPDRETVGRLFARVRHENRLALFQDEALDVLTAYGIPVAPTRQIARAEEAVAAAALLGLPAVVKLRQALAPRERDPGTVILDMLEPEQLGAAARVLSSRQRVPPAGLLVQRQVDRARELAVRVSDDPTFGPVIAFGPGGTTTLDEGAFSTDLPPLNLALANALIRRSPIGVMLSRPLRELPAANTHAVAETLVRISQLIVDWPEISALELNALFADARGVLAADAWLRLRGSHELPAVLAIAPYPAEFEELWSAGGETFVTRPIRPEDAEQHRAFFQRLPPLDVRYRFFSTMRELSLEQIARLTQVDYDREMAFIAVRESSGETVGVARLVRETIQTEGEFAIIVQPDVKGKGLASYLMRRLLSWARQHGIVEVVGQILSDNAPMLAFVRHIGFTLRRMPGDPGVMEARMVL